MTAGEVLGRREHRDRAHRQLQGRDGADALQRARAARHVALHVLHARGGLDRETARVERDRLANEAEQDVSVRGLRRLVAQHDEARLVLAPPSHGGERAHAERVDLSRSEDFGAELLVLGGERHGVLGQRGGIELVRRHVREVACAVRPLRQEGAQLRCVPQFRRLEVAEHDPFHFERPLALVLRLPAAGRVAADDRSLDERARLLRERDPQTLVEQPRERAADARQRSRRCRTRGSERVRVHVCALPEPDRDDARSVEIAVGVQQQRLAALASQLAALRQPRQAASELLVDDPRALASDRLREWDG